MRSAVMTQRLAENNYSEVEVGPCRISHSTKSDSRCLDLGKLIMSLVSNIMIGTLKKKKKSKKPETTNPSTRNTVPIGPVNGIQ